MTTHTYEYLDGTITASFTHPRTIAPEDAAAFLEAAVHGAGGVVVDGFTPGEQDRHADDGYVSADLRIALPDGRQVWINIECPTDAAFAS